MNNFDLIKSGVYPFFVQSTKNVHIISWEKPKGIAKFSLINFEGVKPD